MLCIIFAERSRPVDKAPVSTYGGLGVYSYLKSHRGKFMFFLPVLVGMVIVALAISSRQMPQQVQAGETAKSVRVIAAPEVTLIPRAIGYGNVKPGRVWQAVAQVGGQIVEIHPQLKKGAIIGKDEVLLRIDPTSYKLAITQAEANIRAAKAQVREMDAREQNTHASLKIEQRGQTLAEKELQRKRKLFSNNTVSKASVDKEERTLLRGQQTLQSLRNTLNLIPTERDVLVAQLGQYESQLDSARLNLQYTTIRAPFDGRVAEINVEQTQFAAQGKMLAVLDSIDVSEITAQVPLGRLINLVPRNTDLPGGTNTLMRRLPDFLGFTATVHLRGGSVEAQWNARFMRINDTIDPDTRTVGVIVAVDDPYQNSVPGVRPPLSKNMFVEVEIIGRPQAGQIVAPRSSLHGNTLYVVDGENRLRIKPVVVDFSQTDFVVIKKGLAVGDKIIVSDPIPAIDGMLVKAVVDAEASAALIAQAEGGGAIR